MTSSETLTPAAKSLRFNPTGPWLKSKTIKYNNRCQSDSYSMHPTKWTFSITTPFTKPSRTHITTAYQTWEASRMPRATIACRWPQGDLNATTLSSLLINKQGRTSTRRTMSMRYPRSSMMWGMIRASPQWVSREMKTQATSQLSITTSKMKGLLWE